MLSFKDFLVETFSSFILSSHEDIFILTSFGIKLDYQMINEMTDVYIFDKRLFSSSRDPALIQRYLQKGGEQQLPTKPSPFSIQNPGTNIRNLSAALKQYELWCSDISMGASMIEEHIAATIRNINVIFKSLNIIFQFATNFISGIEKQFLDSYAFIKLLNQKSLHASWSSFYSQLKKFPKIELENRASPQDLLLLANLVSISSLQNAANLSQSHLPPIVEAFNELSGTLTAINSDKLNVDKRIELLRNESITSFKSSEQEKSTQLLEINKLIDKSHTELLNLKSADNSLAQSYLTLLEVASKIFLHSNSLFELSRSLDQFKHKLVHSSLSIFETIASLQMRIVQLRTRMRSLMNEGAEDLEGLERKISTLTMIKEAEDLLSMVVDLPLLFGFILIENRREFEWYDFYSKGIVSNVSEQLTAMIDNEKSFQSLWLKKFGSFLKYISPESSLRIQLPTIDVTLVNANHSKRTQNAVYQILSGIDVTRDDITKYISILKASQILNYKKFANLLERNFKDLVVSTNSLKQATKLISSLNSVSTTSLEADQKLQILRNSNYKAPTTETDNDLNIIKGLRSRISKLEGLLHQQHYKNLSNWPVVRSNTGKLQEMNSLLVELPQNEEPRPTTSPPPNSATTSLQRRSPQRASSSSSVGSRVLDASATIDKHVDNIRLRRDNTELSSRNSVLELENASLRAALDTLKQEKHQQEAKAQELRTDLEEKLNISHQTIENIGMNHEAEIAELKRKFYSERKLLSDEVAQKREENTSLKEKLGSLENQKTEGVQERDAEISKHVEAANELKAQLANFKDEFTELQEIKNELLSNMHAKEADFITERNNLEKDLKELRKKVADKDEDHEHLVEMIQTKEHKVDLIISKLNEVAKGLLLMCDLLVRSNYDYFQEFCYVLESMGLLLVKEADSKSNGRKEYKIRRVKGLRSKKGDGVEADDVASNAERRLHSTVVQEIIHAMDWTTTIRNYLLKHVSPETESREEECCEVVDGEKFEAESNDLIALYEDIFSSTDRAGKQVQSKCGKFLKLISFKEDVQLQWQDSDNDIDNQRFFLNGIAKRFRDVEGFAKKLAKENKAKMQEYSKRNDSLESNKISVGDFKEDDLALFLPTRMDGFGGKGIIPWTAFNIDAPNFFLANSEDHNMEGREWLVLRIKRITKHMVTQENIDNVEENPFLLNVGIKWYKVTAK